VLGAAGFAVGFGVTTAPDRFAGLKDGCIARDNARDCEQLGALLETRKIVPLYPEEPGLYLALACDGGRKDACTRAEVWSKTYGSYDGLELDVNCMVHRTASACEDVATLLRDDAEQASETDPKVALPIARSRMRRALNLDLDGCRANQADACMGASRVYASGFGVEWNRRSAYTYEAKACELGLADACEHQADDTTGEAAIAPYQKACDRTHSPHACLRLAEVEEASGKPQPVIDASYRHACELLAFDACLHVSKTITRLDQESPGVVKAFSRWCDAGEQRACELVKASR
jgi:TPR repeat protein